MIERSADVNFATLWGKTPLAFAVEHAKLENVKLLLAHPNIIVDYKDCKGLTPLHFSANGRTRHEYEEKQKCASLLIAAGADPNAREERGWTPLHLAANTGRWDIVELLTGAGADIDA
jgi:cytohesin